MTAQEYEFYELGPVWHLCTPGMHQCSIFRTREDFVFGMNLVALAASSYRDEVKILTFELMSNHFHFVLACEEPTLNGFFDFIYKRLRRYLATEQRGAEVDDLVFNYFAVNDFRYLLTVIAYVNRNGYLVYPIHTPFTYPWGANMFFFNPCAQELPAVEVSELSIDKKRQIFKSRNFDIQGNYRFLTNSGYISPASYCHVPLAESLFKDARHYFSMISRKVESYSQIAKELGDSIFYTDEEMYAAIYSHCANRYEVKNPTLLGRNDKIEVAKLMKYDYNASNSQIMRMLKIDERILDELFPTTSSKQKKLSK